MFDVINEPVVDLPADVQAWLHITGITCVWRDGIVAPRTEVERHVMFSRGAETIVAPRSHANRLDEVRKIIGWMEDAHTQREQALRAGPVEQGTAQDD